MKYWYTLDSISKRIVRVSGDLSTAMRAFCYTFILGMILKSSGEVIIGHFLLDADFAKSLSVPVLLFVILDILHPALYLVGLHGIQIHRWEFKKYNGNAEAEYDEKQDLTELILQPNLAEQVGLNVVPTILLILKFASVVWLMGALLVSIKFV